MITLVNGNIQNPSGLVVPNGSMSLQLNIDATIIAAPYGIIPANLEIVFQFDANGDILPNAPAAAAQIYSNTELNPQNVEGLGTYYLVTFYDANGARINASPMWWQFTQATNATVDIGQVTPFATVGGNVIFYPTSILIAAPTPSTLGGVFSNVGAAHQWIRSINLNGSVSLSQPSFADISGTIDPSQLPATSTFGASTFTGLITAQAGISLTGTLVLNGATSGAVTITAPAVAGTITNPLGFTNSINIPGGTVFSISTDVGISRVSAGVLAVGNGTAGDASGQINANIINATSFTSLFTSKTLTTATQPTVRLTDSELTLSSAVTSVTGSVAAVRGNITLASGGTITGSSFIYGVQGKLTPQGTLNNGSAFNAGVFAQLDTSNAGFAHTSGYLAPIIADFGATSHLTSDPLADGIVILNTTTSLIHSLIHGIADASYLLDVTDLSFGGAHFVVPIGGATIQTTCLKIRVNGADFLLPLYA